MSIKDKDGHIHTPYCPHGSTDSIIKYVERGITLGYKEMTFTEHAPLPIAFTDPVPDKDSAMGYNQLEAYIKELQQVKRAYAKDVTINIGLEVDFIEDFEEEVASFLDHWGEYLDDTILSVHFLKYPNGQYICLDYSPQSFETLINAFSSIQSVYNHYYKTLKKSILSNLGNYKPRRIGHITLVRKFQKKYPISFDDQLYLLEILHLIKEYNYSIDLNGAGLMKPLCKEFYPPLFWAKKAKDMGIELVYGSDAHRSSDLGVGLNELEKSDLLL